MSALLAEALQQVEAGPLQTVIKVAALLGAFPADHPVRDYATGCGRLLDQMKTVTPLSCETEAMKAVLRTATADDNDRYAGHNGVQATMSVHEVADRIRQVVRPPRADARAALGDRILARMDMAGPRARRPMRRGRY